MSYITDRNSGNTRPVDLDDMSCRADPASTEIDERRLAGGFQPPALSEASRNERSVEPADRPRRLLLKARSRDGNELTIYHEYNRLRRQALPPEQRRPPARADPLRFWLEDGGTASPQCRRRRHVLNDRPTGRRRLASEPSEPRLAGNAAR